MIEVGIVGMQGDGELHITGWQKITNIKIVGFFEPDNAVAKKIVQKYKLFRFATNEELIQSVQLIDVASAEPAYADFVFAAIRKGKNLIVNNELITTLKQAQGLLDLTREARIKLQLLYPSRFNTALVAVKQMSVQPQFIDIKHIIATPYLRPQQWQAMLFQNIDICADILQTEIKTLNIHSIQQSNNKIVAVYGNMEFKNNCVVHIVIATSSIPTHIIYLYQVHDTLVLNLATKQLEGKGITQVIKNSDEPIHLALAAFVAAVRDNKKLIVDIATHATSVERFLKLLM